MSGRKNVLAKDRVGQRYGRLVVISVERKGRRTYATCLCDCGNSFYSRVDALQSGSTVSCGCFMRENAAQLNKSHGMSDTKIYKIWDGIVQRCTNPNHSSYPEYKDRGMCDEWRYSFENFYRDMGEPPPKTSIDRIDNNKGYSKENCRWVCASVQGKNTSKKCKDTAISKYKGVGKDKRAKTTSGYFFRVMKNGKAVSKYCETEIQAAAYFNYCTMVLYDEPVLLNDVDYTISSSEKLALYELCVRKFPELFLKENEDVRQTK